LAELTNRTAATRIAVALLLAVVSLAAAAQADTVVVAPFSGQWTTALGGSTPGTVKFTTISEADGSTALQAMGGHLCGAPTTYYHGDYTDVPPGAATQTGTMTACIVTAGHLVGRWQGGGDSGDIDVTLNSAQNAFDGTFNDQQYGASFTYTGTFASHFPGDGCCVSGGGGSGGGSLAPPASFCSGASLDGGNPMASPAAGRCVYEQMFTAAEQAQARSDLRDYLLAAAYVWSGLQNQHGYAVNFVFLFQRLVQEIAETLQIIHAPTRPSFDLPSTAHELASSASSACPSRLTSARCRALHAAVSKYAQVVDLTSGVAGYLASGASHLSAAVRANSAGDAFVQGAFGKINAGALASDLSAERFYGRALAKMLHSGGLDTQLPTARVKQTESRLASSLIGNQPLDGLVAAGLAPDRTSAQRLLVGELTSFSGPVSAKALGAPLPYTAFAAQYRSISLSELAAVVDAQSRNGDFSNTVAHRLDGDLTSAQAACADRSRRIAAVRKFISDARAQARRDASFLTLGSQPLLASKVASSSCQ
jgi:hypothetical protein